MIRDPAAEGARRRELMGTLNLEEAAELTKCHPSTLRRMAAARQVPATKVGRAWIFSARLLLEWIEERCRDIEPRDGADPRLTREKVATQAGLSERQRKTAIRVASVPEQEFVRQVESESPPTVTQLAEQGKQKLADIGEIPVDGAGGWHVGCAAASCSAAGRSIGTPARGKAGKAQGEAAVSVPCS